MDTAVEIPMHRRHRKGLRTRAGEAQFEGVSIGVSSDLVGQAPTVKVI